MKVKDVECDFDTCPLREFATNRLGCGTPDAGGCPLPWCSDEELEMELEDFIKILRDRESAETDRMHKEYLRKEAKKRKAELVKLAWLNIKVVSAQSDANVVKYKLQKYESLATWHGALQDVHSMFNQAGMDYSGDGISETRRGKLLKMVDEEIEKLRKEHKSLMKKVSEIHRSVARELIKKEGLEHGEKV